MFSTANPLRTLRLRTPPLKFKALLAIESLENEAAVGWRIAEGAGNELGGRMGIV